MAGPPTNKFLDSGEWWNMQEHEKLIEKSKERKIEIKPQWTKIEKSTNVVSWRDVEMIVLSEISYRSMKQIVMSKA